MLIDFFANGLISPMSSRSSSRAHEDQPDPGANEQIGSVNGA
jgi:hypothetical protein